MTFVKACQRSLLQEPPSSLYMKIVHTILIRFLKKKISQNENKI